jgi:hypothetical protein
MVLCTSFSFTAQSPHQLEYFRTIQKVDDTMVSINDQRELAKEIADTISQPFGMPFEEVSVRVFF